jgi:hypothetical protein
MVSRNRSTCGVKPYIRATGNLDADSWVAEFRSQWIDQETGFSIPGRALRYYIRISDDIIWADRPEELQRYMPPAENLPPGRRPSATGSASASRLSRQRSPITRPCCRSTQASWLGCSHCRCSSASGCCWAIGRSGRRPGSISSANGVQWFTRSRPISTWSVIGISLRPRKAHSTTQTGRDRGAVIGCWMWCAFEPTRAMSKGYCSILPHKTEPRSASGFARIRVKPAKARRFIWSGCSLASPWRRPSRAVTRSRGLGHLEQDSKRLNRKGDSHGRGFVIQDSGWGWGQH